MPFQSDGYWFTVDQAGDVTVVRFRIPRLQKEATVEQIGNQLLEMAEDPGRRRLVLDCRSIQGLNSDMLGKLTALSRKLQAAGGRMAICHLNPDVAEIFQVSRLDQLMPVYGTEEEALRTFAG